MLQSVAKIEAAIALAYALEHHEKALKLYQEGEFAAAKEEVEKAIRCDPNAVEPYLLLSDIYCELNQPEEVLRCLSRGLHSHPNSYELLAERALVYHHAEEYPLALEDYTRALLYANENKVRAEVHYNRGLLHYQCGRAENALIDYNAAIEEDPEWALPYYERGNLYHSWYLEELAIKDYSKAIELDNTQPSFYYDRSLSLYTRGQIDEALADLNRALELDPESIDARIKRGIVSRDSGLYDAAVSDFQVALQKDDASPALFQLGVVYTRLEQWSKAIEAFSNFIEREPAHALAYLHRSEAREALDQRNAAISDLLQALRWADEQALDVDSIESRLDALGYKGPRRVQSLVSPSQSEFLAHTDQMPDELFDRVFHYHELAHKYLRLSHTELAIEFFSAAIDLDPDFFESYIGRGRAHSYLEDYNKAVEDFGLAIQRCSQSDYAYYQRSLVRYDQGDVEGALADLDQAISILPYQLEYLNQRGILHMCLGRFEQAISDFQDMVDVDPTDTMSLLLLAQVCLMHEDWERAIENYELVLSLEPENEEALDALASFKKS